MVVVPVTASTSTDLVAAATADPAAWPDGSVLVADHQAAGRGRAGRTWTTPPRAALTVSVLLRPPDADGLEWVPLLGGLAVVRSLADAAGVHAGVKWPNDVLLPADEDLPGWGRRRKVAGVLADLVPGPGGPAVVVGMGINVHQDAASLPVPSATSLDLAGAAVDRTALLGVLVAHLLRLEARRRAGDPGLREEVGRACLTLGREVLVELPGGRHVVGQATRLADDGALVVRDVEGREHVVHAGDVQHVRTGDGARRPPG